MQIEKAIQADGSTPLDQWHKEAAGFQLRYVPSTLPDMVSLSQETDTQLSDARGGGVENVLERVSLDDMDVEIAMPVQTLRDLSARTGLWRDAVADQCRAQLTYMSRVCRENYPSLRLHLYDGAKHSRPPTRFLESSVSRFILAMPIWWSAAPIR